MRTIPALDLFDKEGCKIAVDPRSAAGT